MKFIHASLALAICFGAATVHAQITNIIGDYTTNKGPDVVGPESNLGNGDFQSDVFSGGTPFSQITGWFNLNGSEDINFGQDSGTNGSPQDDGGTPGSLGAMLFGSIVAGNDTGYVVQAEGEKFNYASYLGSFGNGYTNETINAHLITSTTGLNADTDWNSDVTILGTASFGIQNNFFNMVRENGFYTAQAADVGQTVYLALEQLPNESTRFPRIDVVSLSVGELAPITPLVYEFNAADNPPLASPTDPATVWNPSIDGRSVDPANPTERFVFDSAQIANVVNDSAVPGITHSYDAGGLGRGDSPYTSGAGSTEASIEVWFKPNDLSSGEQVVVEFGGSGNGSYIALVDDTLSFHTKTVNNPNPGMATLTAPVLTAAEWTQVAANWTPAGDLELFVNGQSVATASGAALSLWAGGNPAGLGQVANTLAIDGPVTDPDVDGDFNNTNAVDGVDFLVWQQGGSPDPGSSLDLATWEANYGTDAGSLELNGEIAILRVYDELLTSQDVLDSFNDITGASASSAGASVPEPSGILLAIGLTAVGLMMRSKAA